MTEPASKRAKMATEPIASTSTGDTQGASSPPPIDNADGVNRETKQNYRKVAKVQEKWFAPGEQNFKQIRKMGAFADHTLLIENVLNCYDKEGTMMHEPVLITAPRRFGKTTNLSMVKNFLEIECDKNRKPIKRPEDLIKPVTDTPNYELFKGMQIMQKENPAEERFGSEGKKIIPREDLVKEHFGRHPVIYLDFKADAGLSNLNDVVAHCRKVLHRAFKQHIYLRGTLGDLENDFFSSWCDKAKYPTIDKNLVHSSLLDLSEYLYTYFERKVFLLVDEYDCTVREIISQHEQESEMKSSIKFYMNMLGKAIKPADDKDYLLGAMLTGISYIGGMGLSDILNNVTPYRFLGDHKFLKFYGLTDSEVKCIAQRYAAIPGNSDILKDLTYWYNGYKTNSGKEIYSIWSVGRALQEKGQMSSYWRSTGVFDHLESMLKIPQILVYVLQLLNGNDLPIELCGKITVGAIVSLNRNINATRIPNRHLLFSMMLEEGYLTSVESSSKHIQGKKTVKVRLPNEEIKSEILDYTRDYFEDILGFDDTKIEQCANFFETVKTLDTQNDNFKVALEEFHGNLTTVFKGFTDDQIVQMTEDHLQCLMYIISSRADYRRSTEHCIYNERGKLVGRLDLLLLSTSHNFGIIMEFKWNKTRDEANAGDKSKSSLAGLQQIVSRETRYMSALTKHNIEKYCLISISVDKDRIPSISCLLNSEDIDNAIHLPDLNAASCSYVYC